MRAEGGGGVVRDRSGGVLWGRGQDHGAWKKHGPLKLSSF